MPRPSGRHLLEQIGAPAADDVETTSTVVALRTLARRPAKSGQVAMRYRLNRYGDRHLNNALHTVVQSRIQYRQATRDYVARRTAEARPVERSNAALPVTWPETSTACSKVAAAA